MRQQILQVWLDEDDLNELKTLIEPLPLIMKGEVDKLFIDDAILARFFIYSYKTLKNCVGRCKEEGLSNKLETLLSNYVGITILKSLLNRLNQSMINEYLIRHKISFFVREQEEAISELVGFYLSLVQDRTEGLDLDFFS